MRRRVVDEPKPPTPVWGIPVQMPQRRERIERSSDKLVKQVGAILGLLIAVITIGSTIFVRAAVWESDRLRTQKDLAAITTEIAVVKAGLARFDSVVAKLDAVATDLTKLRQQLDDQQARRR